MFHGSSLSHDLVVPIWKSGMSLGLMIDKKTKRFVRFISAQSANISESVGF